MYRSLAISKTCIGYLWEGTEGNDICNTLLHHIISSYFFTLSIKGSGQLPSHKTNFLKNAPLEALLPSTYIDLDSYFVINI